MAATTSGTVARGMPARRRRGTAPKISVAGEYVSVEERREGRRSALVLTNQGWTELFEEREESQKVDGEGRVQTNSLEGDVVYSCIVLQRPHHTEDSVLGLLGEEGGEWIGQERSKSRTVDESSESDARQST
jgi:hypothetical protein